MTKLKTKKAKAIFIIFLIITSSLSLISLSQPVKAAQVCCQKTLSEDYCQYTDESECDTEFQVASALCENTNFCQLGCCNDDNSGICYPNSPKSLCELGRNGEFVDGVECDIPQCEKGACIIGNECSFVTQTRCKAEAAKFEAVSFKFDDTIETEIDAINQCRSSEKGCCVKEDSCTFTTRAACDLTTLTNETGFFANTFCSSASLTCECAPHSYKGCLENEDDVFWFDSCGNPEDIAQECDYSSGTLCGEDNNDFTCLSTDCIELFEDPASPSTNSPKKSGESWCVYDGSVGFGTDLVGSRHYRNICVNGKVLSEPCKDFRQEFCASGNIEFQEDISKNNPFNPGSGTFIEASCLENRWESCFDCNTGNLEQDRRCCENTELRDCFFFQQGDVGSCVPQVPPGSKFWEGEGTDICSQANLECKVVYKQGGVARLFGGDTESKSNCIENCNCLDDDWLIGANNLCKTQGDCGAYFNILGDVTQDGFSNSENKKLTISDIGNWNELSTGGGEVGDVKKASWQTLIYAGISFWAVYGALKEGNKFKQFLGAGGRGMAALFRGAFTKQKTTTLMEQATSRSFLFKPGDTLSAGTKVTMTRNDFNKLDATKYNSDTITSETYNPKTDTVEFTTKTDIKATEGMSGEPTKGATAAQWASTILWIYTIYTIIDTYAAEIKEVTITATCSPWQAPANSNKCESCNSRGEFNGENFKPCTEYACHSLGQNCELLNKDTGNETCVFLNERDTNSPAIAPLKEVLTQGYNVEEIGYGYKIKPDITPFATITFGIETDEPSQCKITDIINQNYNDITTFFGDSLYKNKHQTTIAIPKEATSDNALVVNNGGKYEFYAKCQDGNANQNQRDFIIKFDIQPGPDLTVPSIDSTSIPSGAFVKNGQNELEISAFVNELAECKWSTQNTDYDVMPNSFSCPTSGTSLSVNNLYECKTTLTNIKDNQINTYYFRCKDSSNNAMQESFIYELTGTIPLEITGIEPQGEVANPILKVTTANGAENGKAVCGYSQQNDITTMVTFLETDSNEHSQSLSLEPGTHTFYVQCLDSAGNEATDSTTFTTFSDEDSPLIIGIYEDKSLLQTRLHIKTDEDSICEYSTNSIFTFGSGLNMPEDNTKDHTAPWGFTIYYVICQDLYENISPLYIVYP